LKENRGRLTDHRTYGVSWWSG